MTIVPECVKTIRSGLRACALALALTLLAGGLVIAALEHMEYRSARERARQSMESHASHIRYRVESILSKMGRMEGYMDGSEGKLEGFEHVAESLLKDRSVRAVSVAPGCVVQMCFPDECQQQMRGTDLIASDDGTMGAKLAVARGELTLAGPYNWTDGDGTEILAGRLPIYALNEAGERELWGLVSLLLRFPDVLQSDRLGELEAEGYAYRLWQHHPVTGEGQVLLESKAPLGESSLETQIQIYNADWMLTVSPVGGWTARISLWMSIGILLAISFLMAAFAYILSQRQDGVLVREGDLDETTTLFTRTAGEKRVKRALADRHYRRAAIVLLDVDNFTELNDALGKEECDRLLKHSCMKMKACVRGQDILYRVMDDTMMACILYNGDGAFLPRRVEMLRRAFAHQIPLEDRSESGGGTVLRSHASAGVARMPEDASSFSELYERADMALYWSKRDGRDRHTFYVASSEPLPEDYEV